MTQAQRVRTVSPSVTNKFCNILKQKILIVSMEVNNCLKEPFRNNHTNWIKNMTHSLFFKTLVFFTPVLENSYFPNDARLKYSFDFFLDYEE